MVEKGIYLLVVKLEESRDISVGALGELEFKPGYYLYTGSAKNGLQGRIKRHLSDDKKKHWHIDYLLDEGEIVEIMVKYGDSVEECRLADQVSEFTEPVDDFGCSDCGCDSHLFYHDSGRFSLISELEEIPDLESYR